MSDNDGYTFQSDVWSVGLMLVELATGAIPFAASPDAADGGGLAVPNDFVLLTKIVQGPVPKLDARLFHVDLCDFVAQWYGLTKGVARSIVLPLTESSEVGLQLAAVPAWCVPCPTARSRPPFWYDPRAARRFA